MSYDTTKGEALTEGHAALAASGLGPGWRVRVWENLGWHWSLVSPCLHWQIHPSRCDAHDRRKITGFSAYLNEPRVQATDEPRPGAKTHASGGRWVEDGATPREAMARTIVAAREEIDGLLAIVRGAS